VPGSVQDQHDHAVRMSPMALLMPLVHWRYSMRKRSSAGRMAVNCCGPGEDIEDEDYRGNYTTYMNANDKNEYVGGWVNAQQIRDKARRTRR